MSATVLFYRPVYTGPGHVSLNVHYESGQRKLPTAATITWFADGSSGSGVSSSGPNAKGNPGSGGGTQNVFRDMRSMGNMASRDYFGRKGLGTLDDFLQSNATKNWVQHFRLAFEGADSGKMPWDALLASRVCPPQKEVEIPTYSDPDVCIGLFDKLMVAWWRWFQGKYNDYHILNRSCATVAAEGLLVGGAGDWVKPTRLRGCHIWSPKSVINYAEEIKHKIAAATLEFNAARSLISRAREGEFNGEPVWTSRQWEEASTIRAGRFGWGNANRYDLLKDIDGCLKHYNEKVRSNGRVAASFRRQLELNNLTWIVRKLHAILTHWRHKNSRRKPALLTLGKQALHRIYAIKQEQADEIARAIQGRDDLIIRLEDLRDMLKVLDEQIQTQEQRPRVYSVESVESVNSVASIEPDPVDEMENRRDHLQAQVDSMYFDQLGAYKNLR